MQYVYFRCATKRGVFEMGAAGYEYERIAVDEDLRDKLGDMDWNDPESWEDSGVDIDDCTVFKNLYPLSGEPCFVIMHLYSEDGYENMRLVINGESSILTKHGDLLERVI